MKAAEWEKKKKKAKIAQGILDMISSRWSLQEVEGQERHAEG